MFETIKSVLTRVLCCVPRVVLYFVPERCKNCCWTPRCPEMKQRLPGDPGSNGKNGRFGGCRSFWCHQNVIIFTVSMLLAIILLSYSNFCLGRVYPSCCSGSMHIPGLLSSREHGFKYEREVPVPKLVHFAWYSDEKLTFRFHHFISILSAYKHIKPREIMFWYEREPEGKWWEEAKKIIPVITMKQKIAQDTVYNRNVKRFAAHKSDIVRLEVMMEFGGIYMDLDVVALKSFDPLLQYDTTLGWETGIGLCNGLIVSKPNAPFLKLWHIEYLNFDDNVWDYHSVRLPAELAKTYPQLVHTELDTMHRPNWQELAWLYGEGKIYDWSHNYAIHLWYRMGNVPKDHDPESIKTWDTTVGQLFRYIYYGSPDLIPARPE